MKNTLRLPLLLVLLANLAALLLVPQQTLGTARRSAAIAYHSTRTRTKTEAGEGQSTQKDDWPVASKSHADAVVGQEQQQQHAHAVGQPFLALAGDSTDGAWYPAVDEASEAHAMDATQAALAPNQAIARIKMQSQTQSAHPFGQQKEASGGAYTSASTETKRQSEQHKQKIDQAISDDELRYADAREEDAMADDEADVEQLDLAHQHVPQLPVVQYKSREARLYEQSPVVAREETLLARKPQSKDQKNRQQQQGSQLSPAESVASATKEADAIKQTAPSSFVSHSGWMPAPVEPAKLAYSVVQPTAQEQQALQYPTQPQQPQAQAQAQPQTQQEADKFVDMFSVDARKMTSVASKTDAAIEYLRNILRTNRQKVAAAAAAANQQQLAVASNSSGEAAPLSRFSSITSKLNQILSANSNATVGANSTTSSTSENIRASSNEAEANKVEAAQFELQSEGKFTSDDVKSNAEQNQKVAKQRAEARGDLIRAAANIADQYQMPLPATNDPSAAAQTVDSSQSTLAADQRGDTRAESLRLHDAGSYDANQPQQFRQAFSNLPYSSHYFQLAQQALGSLPAAQSPQIQLPQIQLQADYYKPQVNTSDATSVAQAPATRAPQTHTKLQPLEATTAPMTLPLYQPSLAPQPAPAQPQQAPTKSEDLSKTLQESKLYSNFNIAKSQQQPYGKQKPQQQSHQPHQHPHQKENPATYQQQQQVPYQPESPLSQQQQAFYAYQSHQKPQKQAQTRLISLNYPTADAHYNGEGELTATQYQLDDSLYRSNGAFEKHLSSSELESIRSQFQSAEHPIVAFQNAADTHHQQQQPTANSQLKQVGLEKSVPQYHQTSTSQLYQRQQQQQQQLHEPSLSSLLNQFRVAEGEEQLKELASLDAAPAIVRPDTTKIQPEVGEPQVPAGVQASAGEQTQKNALLAKLFAEQSMELSHPQSQIQRSSGKPQNATATVGDGLAGKKNLIVYLNHPRPSGISKLRLQQAAAAAAEKDEETAFVAAAKEYDFAAGLSKETKQLDVSNLVGKSVDGDGDSKDGLSVVVIGDAYKYKKIILLISSKADTGLKLIPMVKDLSKK